MDPGAASIGVDEFYFGTKEVSFKHVDGTFKPFVASEWRAVEAADNSSQILERLKHREDGVTLAGFDHPVKAPGVPAVDFAAVKAESSGSGSATSNNLMASCPPMIRRPLMKCEVSDPAAMAPCGSDEAQKDTRMVASGVRSALLKTEGSWYRLKGCGNDASGFPVRTHSKPVAWQEIRGCAFPHTAVRELMTTSLVGTALAAAGVVSANTAVGTYHYRHPAVPPDAAPDLQPVCVVERTLGDRRLGTHVLGGLEIILPLLLGEGAIDLAALRGAFPAGRPREECKDNVIATGSFMTDYALGTSVAGGEEAGRGLCWPDAPRDASTLLFLGAASADYRLPVVSPSAAGRAGSSSCPSQWTASGPRAASARWVQAWDRTCAELEQHLATLQHRSESVGGSSFIAQRPATGAEAEAEGSQPAPGSAAPPSSHVLSYLFSRLGRDAGVILRGLHSLDMSWGTFQDGFCRRDLDEWHCNAHANNLVVVPEGSIPPGAAGSECLLSVLDFDMAYTASSFVDAASGAVGMDAASLQHLKWREHVNLLEVLAGSDSSMGVPRVAASFVNAQSEVVKEVKSALYDTLVLAYTAAYEGGSCSSEGAPIMPFDAALHRAAHCVMRLAIIVMADYVA